MSTPNATSASLKLMPSELIKNVRATAALVLLNLLYQERSMGEVEKFTFAYNAFHGNEGKHFASQIKLLFEGQGKYAGLYNTDYFVVADRNNEATSNRVLVLKSIFTRKRQKLRKIWNEAWT